MKKTIYLFALSLYISGLTNAQTFENKSEQLSKRPSTTGYVENKGQIFNQFGKTAQEVKYISYGDGMNIQLRKNSFSYDSYSATSNQKNSNFHYNRVDVELVNANKNPEIIASGKSNDYTNYYNAGVADGINFVYTYKNIIYKSIYNGIDLEFKLSETGKPEYDFIIAPGADVSQIKLKYLGAPVELRDGLLSIKVINGTIEETIPASWYKTGDGSLTQIAVQYKQINKNTFAFVSLNAIPSYAQLFIDPIPNRVWATYFGHIQTGQITDERIWDMSIDPAGNIIVTGQTTAPSPQGGIATTGAYDVIYGGGITNYHDAFIEKFDATNGSRLYGTYFGGTGQDYGTAIKVDNAGNVYMAGSTFTDTIGPNLNVISTPGALQSRYYGSNGSLDGFLVKFNSTGQRIWSTYYGGWYGATRIFSMALSQDNQNVYFFGITQTDSTTNNQQQPNIMYTPGAFQTTLKGAKDNFIAQFDSSGNRVWGTYFGGDGSEEFQDIEQGGSVIVDSLNNIYICGASNNATNFPLLNGLSFGGLPTDGYFAKFDASHNLVFSSFLGAGVRDIACDMAFQNNSLYILGRTNSSGLGYANGFQIHNPNPIGATDNFLTKFDVSTSSPMMTWFTYYGGVTDDYSYRMEMNHQSQLLISGTTNSSTQIATPNSYQATLNLGTYDAFVAKFDTNGALRWGTYFGGPDYDGANTIAVDNTDNVYLAGITNSLTGIGFGSSSYMLNYGGGNGGSGGNVDGFVVKFDSTLYDPNTGVNDVFKNPSVSIFPNPANDLINVQASNVLSKELVIEIRNITGQLIMSRQIKSVGNTIIEKINVKAVSVGTYIISLKTGKGEIFNSSFIKQ